jgi:hypothetical protein
MSSFVNIEFSNFHVCVNIFKMPNLYAIMLSERYQLVRARSRLAVSRTFRCQEVVTEMMFLTPCVSEYAAVKYSSYGQLHAQAEPVYRRFQS